MEFPSTIGNRQVGEVTNIENLDFLVRESAEAYYDKSFAHLSSFGLGLFRRSPILYQHWEFGHLPDGEHSPCPVERAAHVLILEGADASEESSTTCCSVNPETSASFGPRAGWVDRRGLPLLSDEQIGLMNMLQDSVYSHRHARDLLEDGVPRGVVRTDYCGSPCKARLDWLNPERGIVELKVCDSVDDFETDFRAGVDAHQLAFYRSLLACEVGGNMPVHIIGVERYTPFRTGVWRIANNVLDRAQRENEDALGRLWLCNENHEWPSGYENIRVLSHLQ